MHSRQSLIPSVLLRLLLLPVERIAAQLSQPKETLVIGTKSLTVNPTNVVLNTTVTLRPGASAITVDNEPVSVDSAYDVFVAGTLALTGTANEGPSSSSSHVSLVSSRSVPLSTGPVSSSSNSESIASTASSLVGGSSPTSRLSGVAGSTASIRSSVSNGSGPASSIFNSASSAPSSKFPSSSVIGPSSIISSGSGSVKPPLTTGGSSSKTLLKSTVLAGSGLISTNLVGTGISSSSNSPLSSRSNGIAVSSSANSAASTGLGRPSSSLVSSGTNASPIAPFPSKNTASSASIALSSPFSSGAISSSKVPIESGSSPSSNLPSSSKLSRSSGTNASPGSTANATSAFSTLAPSGSGTVPSPASYIPSGVLLPSSSIGTSSPAATSQAVIFGALAGRYARQGKEWGNSITVPAIRTQALNDNRDFSLNAVAAFTNVGGKYPPDVNACGGGSGLKGKRDLLGGIKNLAGDVRALAGCGINIASDLEKKIDVPPGTTPDFAAIDADFTGLEQLSQEENNNDNDSSTSQDQSSAATSASSSSAGSSARSSASSSVRSSITSSARSSASSSVTSSANSSVISSVYSSANSSAISSFSLSLPTLITDAGLGDVFTADLSNDEVSSIDSVASAGLAAHDITSGASILTSGGISVISSNLPSATASAANQSSSSIRISIIPQPTTGSPTSTSPPSSTITSAPTNVPGQNGLPGCAAVIWTSGNADCPYASGINYCNCGGTIAAPLSTTGSFINCDIKTQPSSNNCPINTQYSQSLASASSATAAADASSVSAASAASAVSVSSAAAVFNPSSTTTSCGALFGYPSPVGSQTAVPRANNNIVEEGVASFCTPQQGTTVVQAGQEPPTQNYALPNTNTIYQFSLEQDTRPECSSHPLPSIVPGKNAPDHDCSLYMLTLLNGCDVGDGQDKRGGRIFINCAIYEWTAFTPPSGFNEFVITYPYDYNPPQGKRDLEGPTPVQRDAVMRHKVAKNFVA